MSRLLIKLFWPLLALLLCTVWLYRDMHSTPQGDVDYQFRLNQPATWVQPMAYAPRRMRETVFHPGVSFNAIRCVDALRCWVVGEGGTIVATHDGGKSWQAQTSGTTAELNSVHMQADGQHGWAVGGDVFGGGGTIVATQDGGQSWRAQTSGTTVALNSVHMNADGQHGWAVGLGGTIVATQDGGKSWQVQTSGTTLGLMSMHVQADGQHGWAVGDSGTIVATQDGGKRWQAQASGTTAWLMSVHMQADGQHGWTVGNNGTIVATQDGGKNWQEQTSGTTATLYSVHMQADGQHGWAVGNNGTIVATQDGGKSWQAQTSGTTAGLNSMHMQADSQHGWAVGSGGTIVATQDGGKSWQPRTSGTTESLKSMHIHADGQRGWMVGSGGMIMATQDGGKSWWGQTSGTTLDLNGVHIHSDAQHGWVVGGGVFGGGSTILATQDGGKSWQTQTSDKKEGLNSVYIHADGQHGWAVGNDGVMMKTQDGGKSWQEQTIVDKGIELRSVHIHTDGQHGWVVGGGGFGGGGTIVASQDGGKSWQQQTSDIYEGLHSVHIQADGQRGWAVGDGGTIVVTQDGGKHWRAQTSGTKAGLSSVHFHADGEHGWAVGNSGTIVVTQDGGKSWQAQASGTTAGLNSVHIQADGQHGWAMGDGGTIVATQDGGKHWQVQTGGGMRAELMSVFMQADSQYGWVVGDGGTIVVTQDGGKSWQEQTSGTTTMLRSVHIHANGQRGWAVGDGGTIVATQDGGKIWQAQGSGTTERLNSMHMQADGQYGWAVGERGTIVVTQDGGKSWQEQTTDTTDSLRSVHIHADSQHGWAVGERGTIVATQDGGKSWQEQTSGTTELLSGVRIHADGQRGWAVGWGGTIVTTSDGGKSWQEQTSGTRTWLRSVHIHADGQRGWAVGDSGTIVATQDGGKSWQAQTSGTNVDLNSMHMHADGQRGWAVGNSGTIVATQDGGRSWQPQDDQTRKPGIDPRPDQNPKLYPSPAALLALFAVVLWLALQLLHLSTDPDALRHHDAGGYHDNPINRAEDDRLGTAPLARALALLLRNQDTAPPLALAVCAPWGQGKSSVLGMLAKELQAQGAHPIWFNAWHYRDDTQLLAALMEHVRDQAFPSGYNLRSVAFRGRLLWLRVLRPWAPLAALVGVAYVSSVFWPEAVHSALREQTAAWWTVVQKQAGLGSLIDELGNRYTTLLGLLAALVTAATQLPKTQPFTNKLSKMVEGGRTWFFKQTEVADMKKEAGFRYLFQQEFAQVCTAMGRGRLVLIIDDLDRCDPPQIDKVMSTLNFLFSCAQFHAVLGMDWAYVRSAVGLAYKDMAKELAGSDDAQARQRFGENFLEKIVQLRLNLPQADATSVVFRLPGDDGVRQPAQPTPVPAVTWRQVGERLRQVGAGAQASLSQWRLRYRQNWKQAWRDDAKVLGRGLWVLGKSWAEWFKRLPPGSVSTLAGFVLTGLLVWHGMQWLGPNLVTPPEVKAQTGTSQTVTAAAAAGSTPSTLDMEQREKLRAAAQGRAVPMYLPEPNNAWSVTWWGSWVVGLLAVLFWLLWAKSQIRDSDGFRRAMQAWGPELKTVIHTPRGWRRLQNMARFAAMRVRVEAGAADGWATQWQRLRQGWAAWVLNQPELRPQVEADEALIVSLLAAHKRYPGLVPLLHRRVAWVQSWRQAQASLGAAYPQSDADFERLWTDYVDPSVIAFPMSPAEYRLTTDIDWLTSELTQAIDVLVLWPPPWWFFPSDAERLLACLEQFSGWSAEDKRVRRAQLESWQEFFRILPVIQAAILVCDSEQPAYVPPTAPPAGPVVSTGY